MHIQSYINLFKEVMYKFLGEIKNFQRKIIRVNNLFIFSLNLKEKISIDNKKHFSFIFFFFSLEEILIKNLFPGSLNFC